MGETPMQLMFEGCGLPTLVYLAREEIQYHHNFKAGAMNALFMCVAEKVRSCIWSLIYLTCGLDSLLQGMGDLFWLAFLWMRASLLKLDLAFLRPLISFVGRFGFAVEDESGAVWDDPFEHGEVFVLDDGGEVDLDLGNYERFLDVTLTRDNNITTGKIYQSVLDKEGVGDYLRKTIQVVAHINAVKTWIESVSLIPVDGKEAPAYVYVIELGGTVGDS